MRFVSSLARFQRWITPTVTAAMAADKVAASSGKREIAPGKTRIGWIGTGVMGRWMCGHILDAGYALTVYNRTPSKAQDLCGPGQAFLADSPLQVAQRSDVVFTIVGYPADVRQVILGPLGILEGLEPGGIVVDMTTSEPALAREIAARALDRGCHALDAPVSGGDRGAKAGKLSIMVGGDLEVYTALAPLFQCMGSPTFMGAAGSGQSCKLANQVTIATTMVGLVEGMLFAHNAGLDVESYVAAIAGGAAGSKSLELYAQRIQRRDFQPGFYVNHFVKDLGIAINECSRLDLCLPGLALAQQLYVSLKAHGDGNLGTQALVLALERLNNIQLLDKKP
ncbi:probable 3-hydroxyisobutyrate dehydrogenase-like 1, mitochondrial [Selaginella moellendorffii]|nr:probable 3-hydroxyisobutyrate dehydrogenase-like 1, mitochondrial [Selaginella moellendorffii]|eukprot:XP_002987766.2 probable 3-hydroxyisobutyrate dehydrogenase-like 1, mitochondrial [Selaginella moellendorffii]